MALVSTPSCSTCWTRSGSANQISCGYSSFFTSRTSTSAPSLLWRKQKYICRITCCDYLSLHFREI